MNLYNQLLPQDQSYRDFRKEMIKTIFKRCLLLIILVGGLVYLFGYSTQSAYEQGLIYGHLEEINFTTSTGAIRFFENGTINEKPVIDICLELLNLEGGQT